MSKRGEGRLVEGEQRLRDGGFGVELGWGGGRIGPGLEMNVGR
jgi:hypothetical protein